MSCNHDKHYMDSCYLCTKCLDEQEAELARVKQECAGLKDRIITMPMRAFDMLQEQAKEAGALSMLTFMAAQQGRNLATHPTWTAERMEEWRAHESRQEFTAKAEKFSDVVKELAKDDE